MFSLKRFIAGAHGKAIEIALTSGVYFDTSSPPAIFASYGYDPGIPISGGAVSPSTVRGATISQLKAVQQPFMSPNATITITLSGTLSQDFFSRFYHSSCGWINSADAGFSTSGGYSTWLWSGLIDANQFTSETVLFD